MQPMLRATIRRPSQLHTHLFSLGLLRQPLALSLSQTLPNWPWLLFPDFPPNIPSLSNQTGGLTLPQAYLRVSYTLTPSICLLYYFLPKSFPSCEAHLKYASSTCSPLPGADLPVTFFLTSSWPFLVSTLDSQGTSSFPFPSCSLRLKASRADWGPIYSRLSSLLAWHTELLTHNGAPCPAPSPGRGQAHKDSRTWNIQAGKESL